MASDEDVLVAKKSGSISVLQLNRPDKANALNPQLMAALGEALIGAESDEGIRCVVLTGTGSKCFCAGMDLEEFSAQARGGGNERTGSEGFLRFLRGEIDVPVVAAVNGAAVGGGVDLLLACDLSVAASHARFSVPEAKRGLLPTAALDLRSRVSLTVALELLLTGDVIDAERALALGLINRVVDESEVMEAALVLAGQIAANAPMAVKATRQITRAGASDPSKAEQLAEYWKPIVFGSDDALEGAKAFLEKRPPVWRGC